MKVIHQDLLSVQEGIIAHQTNTQFVMGAGVALAIRRMYPKAYNHYMMIQGHFRTSSQFLGYCQFVPVTDKLTVANIFAQDTIGGPDVNTDYDAVRKAFATVEECRADRQVYIPYKMGCDLAGGDFDIYSAIVDEVCPGVIACSLHSIPGVTE